MKKNNIKYFLAANSCEGFYSVFDKSFLPDGESAEYRMYRDDGVTTEYEKKEHWKTLQIHHS